MNLKKIVKELNEYALTNKYDKPRMLRAELTSFNAAHRVNRGRNGVSELLELQTQVSELNAVHIEQRSTSTIVEIYTHSNVRTEHSFRSNTEGVFVKVRNSKGAYKTAVLIDEKDSENANRLFNLLNYPDLTGIDAQDFERFVKNAMDDHEAALKVTRINDETPEGPTLNDLKRKYTLDVLEIMAYNLKTDRNQDKFEKVLEHIGFSLSVAFVYTERFWVSPEFINETRNGFEIGWNTKATYNSLPVTLKIEKAQGIKTISLKEIGIEGAGYYSHSDNMQILPEQVEEAKRFAKRFESAKSKQLTRVLNKAA